MATDFTILDMTFYFLRLSSMSVSTRAPHSTCRRAALTERAGKPAARQDSQNGHCHDAAPLGAIVLLCIGSAATIRWREISTSAAAASFSPLDYTALSRRTSSS
jgi:hypothetical protein